MSEAVGDYGIHTVVDTCLALLDGHTDYDLLPMPLSYLGGAGAVRHLEQAHLRTQRPSEWPRLWAARGLRYAWLPYAEPGVVAALSDRAWRVREMAAKVVAQREIHPARDALVPLLNDGTSRVRVAAIRALGVVGAATDLDVLDRLPAHDRVGWIAIDGARRKLRVGKSRRDEPAEPDSRGEQGAG